MMNENNDNNEIETTTETTTPNQDNDMQDDVEREDGDDFNPDEDGVLAAGAEPDQFDTSDVSADDSELDSDSVSPETEQVLEAIEAGLEEALEAKPEAPSPSPEHAEKEKKEKAQAAHLSFIAAAKAHAEALGLQTKDQKGYFQIVNVTTGHKLYVAKQVKDVTRIDTTLPQDSLGDLAVELEKGPGSNGRITCHVKPTAEALNTALDLLASYGEKIPAPRKPTKHAE